MEGLRPRRGARAGSGRAGAVDVPAAGQQGPSGVAGFPRGLESRIRAGRGVLTGTRGGVLSSARWLGLLGLVLPSWASWPGSAGPAAAEGLPREARARGGGAQVGPGEGSLRSLGEVPDGVRFQPRVAPAAAGRDALPALPAGALRGAAARGGRAAPWAETVWERAPSPSGGPAGAWGRDVRVVVESDSLAANLLPRARSGQGEIVCKVPGRGGFRRATEFFRRHSLVTRTVRSRKASRPDVLATPCRSPGWEVAPSGRARFPCRLPGSQRALARDRRMGIEVRPGAPAGSRSGPGRLRTPGVGRSRDAPSASRTETLFGAFRPEPALAAVRPARPDRRARSPCGGWEGGEGLRSSRPAAPEARTGSLVERAAAGS